MSRIAHPLIGLALVLLVGTPALAQSIEGTYALQGTNPDKKTYSGTVLIEKSDPGYKVTWQIPGSADVVGVGLYAGTTLSVAYSQKNVPGIVTMSQQSDSSFKGLWFFLGMGNSAGEEIWTKK